MLDIALKRLKAFGEKIDNRISRDVLSPAMLTPFNFWSFLHRISFDCPWAQASASLMMRSFSAAVLLELGAGIATSGSGRWSVIECDIMRNSFSARDENYSNRALRFILSRVWQIGTHVLLTSAQITSVFRGAVQPLMQMSCEIPVAEPGRWRQRYFILNH